MSNRRNFLIFLLVPLLICTADDVVAQIPGTLKEIATSGRDSTDTDRYADGLRRWTPADSVNVRYFADYTGSGAKPTISPDGTKFFFVTYRGDVLCDCNIFELTVFATEDVHQALAGIESARGIPPKPLQRLVRKSSRPQSGTLWLPTWESDGETISFQGKDEHDLPQYYLFNVRSGAVNALTKWSQNASDQVRKGDAIFAVLEVSAPAPSLVYPVHIVTREELNEASFPRDPATDRMRAAVFVSYRGGEPWQLKSSSFLRTAFAPILSSGGRRAVASLPPQHVPDAWAARDGYDWLERQDISQFILIDAEHGLDHPAFDAPIGTATRAGAEAQSKGLYPSALWAEDDKHVIFVNTALPLLAEQHSEHRRMAYIVGFNADTGQWVEIEPVESHDDSNGTLRRVTQVGWLKPGKELLVGHAEMGKPSDGTVYTRQGDQWIGRTVDPTLKLPDWAPTKPPALAGGLTATLKQGANEPPIIVASDGRHEIALTSPDPAVQGAWLARQEPFQWREPRGSTTTGGLLLPRDKKGPVPLVIQAYTYDPNEFAPDGPGTHAYAAQSLVARGMAVLNINIPGEGGEDPSTSGTPREGPEFAERVDSAIDVLASRGLIDPHRVGLVGFSRAGFNAYYAITHPGKHPAAAAVIDDAFTGTYTSYLFDSGQFGSESGGYESLYGGPFWRKKNVWLEQDSSFNVDRVQTPALFSVHHYEELPLYATDLGAFALNHRPIEYILYPNATHQLKMPRQRLASYEVTVDWMSFWLRGETPSDPERARRWTKLREQQQAVLDELTATGKEVAPLPKLIRAPNWVEESFKRLDESITQANRQQGSSARVY